jgi:hypothetical protein
MTLQELRERIGADTATPTIPSGLLPILADFHGGDFSFAKLSVSQPGSNFIEITGTVGSTTFPSADLRQGSVGSEEVFCASTAGFTVRAVIQLVTPDQVLITLTLIPPAEWTFHKSFPAVGSSFEAEQITGSLTNRALTLSNAGLSFSAQWTPGGVLGVLTPTTSNSVLLTGRIVRPGAQSDTLSDKFPWETPTISGLHLEAPVATGALAGTSFVTALVFHAYSPLLTTRAGVESAVGFSGTLTIPDAPGTLSIGALKVPGVDQILLNARGPAVTIGLGAPLTALLGAVSRAA